MSSRSMSIAIVVILLASLPAAALSLRPELAAAAVQGIGGPECGHFQFQEDAQDFLERNDWITLTLDPDGDGIACNELPSREDVLPPLLLDAMMLEMGLSSNFPQISFDFDLEAYLAGFVHQWDVEDVEGVQCPELSSGDTFHELIPGGSVVFLQDAGGHAPQEDPDATYMDPTWVANALLWVWDGESEPVNVNDWILRNGYGVYSEADTQPEWRAKFELAGQTARAQGAGVWGDCRMPAELMLQHFEPTHEPPAPTLVASVRGDWSESANFTISQDGTYGVVLHCPGPSCYIEVKTLRHLPTGQEFPQLYFVLFGPDEFYTEIFLPAGTYLVQIEGVGGWRFTVDSLE